MTKICQKALVSGRVQGVYFRATTKQKALQLNITGYAKNLPDGRVEVLACGESDKVSELVDWLHIGSAQAKVEHVLSERNEYLVFEQFEVM